MKRSLCLLAVLILVISLCPVRSQAAVPADFKGLVLTAPSNVTVKLYTGFTDGSLVKPDYTETGTVNSYYYSVASGNYRYVSTGTGYIKTTKCIYMSSAEAATKTVVDATPAKALGTGWETPYVNRYSDEAIKLALQDDVSQWPDYAEVFTTPWFTEPHGEQQMTTQEQMESFLYGLDDTNDNMYVYSLGTASGTKSFNIPVVFFAAEDLSEATTLQSAAAKLDPQKPTILYRAQVHGNEPAAGEGALGVIKRLDGTFGESVLDRVNVCIIPRMNPDGAYKYERYLNSGDDPNRDHLIVANEETRIYLALYQMLMPEILIDGHEYATSIGAAYLTDGDITISVGHSIANTEAFGETGIDMMLNTFSAMAENGLNYRFYSQCINGYNPNVGGQYVSRQGTLFFLLESRGIRAGLDYYARRVISHVVSAESIISQTADNAEEIVQLVADERAKIISDGATYEESDQVILATGGREDTNYTYNMNRYYQKGVKNTLKATPEAYDIILRSRTAPTAYVIAAGESYTQSVLDLMDKQGISYEYLPVGTCIMLQQYTGTVEEAALTDESLVTFPNGAYVFCKNQYNGIILSMLMEPDCDDAGVNKATLAQQGILAPTDGVFPIYRYIRDLNKEGTIDTVAVPDAPTGLQVHKPTALGQLGSVSGLDPNSLYEYRVDGSTKYTPVNAGSSSIQDLDLGTYYIRYQAAGKPLPSADAVVTITYDSSVERIVYLNGNATTDGNGFTEATAAKTIETAYAQLGKVLAGFPEGSSGTIVVIGNYTLEGDTVKLPSHTFPVVITGKTPQDGLVYAPTSATQADRQLVLGGPTTLENTTLTYKSTRTLSTIYAAGHPFTVGKNVTTVPASSGYHLNIAGGTYTGSVNSTEITIHSGVWKNIYVGGFACTVGTTSKFTMTGGEVVTGLYANYRKNTGESVTMDISNAKIGKLYCGNAYKEDLSADVTLTLGEGFSCPIVYAGSRDEGNVNGTVTIIVDGADLTDTGLYGICQNVNGNGATVKKSILILKDGKLSSMEGFDKVILDTSAGGTVQTASDLTVDSVVGGGTLQLGKVDHLTVTDTVSGITGIAVADGTVGSAYVTAPASVASGSFVYTGDGKLTKRDTSWYLEALSSPAASVQVGAVTYKTETLEEAFQTTASQPVITLLKDHTDILTIGRDATLDLNGKHIIGTVIVAEGITLWCMDNYTADYDVSDGQYGTIAAVSGAGTVTGLPALESQDAYLMIRESDGISFHAVTLNISSMTLRPSTAGLYFTADFQADALVKAKVRSFGVAMSVEGTPDTLVAGQHTSFDGSKFGAATSSILNGVLKVTNNKLNNQRNAELPVYARAYIQLDSGECLFGLTQERSLLQQVLLIDEDWQTYGNQDILDMYKTYRAVMDAWDIPNLKAAAN